jgi:hypothetical protein
VLVSHDSICGLTLKVGAGTPAPLRSWFLYPDAGYDTTQPGLKFLPVRATSRASRHRARVRARIEGKKAPGWSRFNDRGGVSNNLRGGGVCAAPGPRWGHRWPPAMSRPSRAGAHHAGHAQPALFTWGKFGRARHRACVDSRRTAHPPVIGWGHVPACQAPDRPPGTRRPPQAPYRP